MATIFNFKLFNNACGGCGKKIGSHAIDRIGTLPKVYCDSTCETEAKRKDQFNKPISYRYPRYR